MKVTVKPKPVKENIEIPFDEIPVGYVYTISKPNGPILLKLGINKAVLLTYSGGSDCFEMADSSMRKPAYKILGKLTEIIVEEI